MKVEEPRRSEEEEMTVIQPWSDYRLTMVDNWGMVPMEKPNHERNRHL